VEIRPNHAERRFSKQQRGMEMRTYKLRVGGESFEAKIVEYSESKIVVNLNGDFYDVDIEPETVRSPQVRSASAPRPEGKKKTPKKADPVPVQASRLSAGMVIAPIPGVVRSILVKEGDSVSDSDVLLILEAMKMENQITARAAGTVKTIHVAVGDSVQEEQVLIDIEEN
jgi:biotin carboxyl carrier protein